MKIQGEFINKEGRTVSVVFTAATVTGNDITIGDSRADGRSLYFADESAVTTESGFNDSTDVIISQSATVNLQSEGFVPELSGRSFRDVGVEVSMDGKCVFAGYLEPNTYNQPYVDVLDDLSLNCVDVLSSLQYRPFRDVGGKKQYSDAVAAAGRTTFWNLLREALIDGSDGFTVLYDGSRKTTTGTAASVFDDLSASDSVFLGDDEDDVETYQDVVEAVLKYLNLHIVQCGKVFFIFSWESVRKGNISWLTLYGNSKASDGLSGAFPTVTLNNDIAGDTDGEITVNEAFNKLILKVSPKSIDEFVSSPLDDTESAYPRRMHYCTELASSDLDQFRAMIAENADLTTMLDTKKIDSGFWREWYVLVKRNAYWSIGRAGIDMVEKYKTNDRNQENIVNQLALYPGACLASIGSVDFNVKEKSKEDNSPNSRLDMSNYMVISVSYQPAVNSTRDKLVNPLAVYTGGNTGVVLSPPDSKTTNYIVIAGTMRLEKKENQSITVDSVEDAPVGLYLDIHGKALTEQDTVKSRDIEARIKYSQVDCNDKGNCYKIYKWYKSGSEGSFGNLSIEDLNPQGVTFSPVGWPSDAGNYSNGLRMPSDFDKPDFEFEYSAIGDKTDRLSKVPVLECMLVIGNKVLVEDMSGNGNINSLSWKTYKTMEECEASHPNDTEAAEDEYYSQTFSIGIDPKIGDHLLNEDHDIQTNFTWETGLDTDNGMAIPIRYSDHLSGAVKFSILGIVNSFYYNKITYRHRTWFRPRKWTEEAIPLMENVRNIFIRDFSIKLYSDNAMSDNEGDNNGDIIYMSDTDESYYNKKDDLEFKIHSAFTTEECAAQGLSPVIANTTVSERSGDGCLSIVDTVSGETTKAEAEYVSEYYDELHLSRVSMTLSLRDVGGNVSLWQHYHSPAMGKNFYMQSLDRDLQEGTATVTMKEIW